MLQQHAIDEWRARVVTTGYDCRRWSEVVNDDSRRLGLVSSSSIYLILIQCVALLTLDSTTTSLRHAIDEWRARVVTTWFHCRRWDEVANNGRTPGKFVVHSYYTNLLFALLKILQLRLRHAINEWRARVVTTGYDWRRWDEVVAAERHCTD
jgi:hypothetical protein